VSSDADRSSVALPQEWDRLARAAEDLSLSAAQWARRARDAEEEVERLRRSLEEVAGDREGDPDVRQDLRRLKAENAALHSRMLQARKRVAGLMQRLAALEIENG
jgi:predicted RNase H-like nuclease (RuvC/YqgF family)